MDSLIQSSDRSSPLTPLDVKDALELGNLSTLVHLDSQSPSHPATLKSAMGVALESISMSNFHRDPLLLSLWLEYIRLQR